MDIRCNYTVYCHINKVRGERNLAGGFVWKKIKY